MPVQKNQPVRIKQSPRKGISVKESVSKHVPVQRNQPVRIFQYKSQPASTNTSAIKDVPVQKKSASQDLSVKKPVSMFSP